MVELGNSRRCEVLGNGAAMSDRLTKERAIGGSRRLPDDLYHRKWMDRVLENVEKTEAGCWLWAGAVGKWGYGETGYRSTNVRVHRKLFELVNDQKLTRWQLVCHRCDTPRCIRPSHLFLGTPADNIKDSADKKRHRNARKTHCKRGHPLEGDNVYIKPDDGARSCKTCSRDRQNRDWNAPDGWRKQYHKDRRARIKVQRQGEAS